ncbi:hypothetical protein [Streptomyces gobiensis]|uniref:hypothetical protein n=1 Tax=Streptomyces gobiensis TaxID=2875706 RepID=UPI001E2ECFC2|nr:hypothetical protein [Streptomyces gobiensis]UGY94644.1 hypothetical protein test1122_24860 [Streptomyces gobiensis]
MKHLLGFIAFILIAQGIGGIVHYFFDSFALWTTVHRIGFLNGYEMFACVVLLVLGTTAAMAASKASE